MFLADSSGEVCGSDGLSYVSECELLRTICREKTHVMITTYSSCGTGDESETTGTLTILKDVDSKNNRKVLIKVIIYNSCSMLRIRKVTKT